MVGRGMTVRVLAEKVRGPAAGGLPRPRIDAQLLGGPGAALLLGPAGAGKTTVLAHVAARLDTPVAWYRLGPEDGSEAVFAAILWRSVQLARGHARTSQRTPESVDELIGLLEGEPDPLTLILDDVHALEGTPAAAAVDRLIELRPRGVRLLMAGRTEAGLHTARMIAGEQLVVVGADSLRFRWWEVEELFRGVYDEPLSPRLAATLTRRVGGWAAGLQLFHLANRGRTAVEREASVLQLTGRSRLIHSYLTQNVLDQLPERLREFLVATAPLRCLTGAMCDELLGTSGSAATLRELENLQMFTSSTDGLVYRHHQVLQSHLEVMLHDSLGPAELREAYARAARVLEEHRRDRDAAIAWARAAEWDRLSRLLRRSGQADQRSANGALEEGFAPEQDPWIAIAQGRRHLRNGDIDAAVRRFERAEALLEDDEEEAARACRLERLAAQRWLLRAGSDDVEAPGLSGRVRALARRVPGRLPTGGTGDDVLVAAIADLWAGRITEAVHRLRAEVPDRSVTATSLGCRLALLYGELAVGAREHADRRIEELELDADENGYGWIARQARVLQAAMLLGTEPRPWRAATCLGLVHECERADDPWGAMIAAAVICVPMARAGRAADMGSALRAARRTAELADAPVAQMWLETLTAGAAGPVAETVARDLRSRARALGVDGEEDPLWLIGLFGAGPPATQRATEPATAPATAAATAPAPAPPGGAASPGLRMQMRCFGEFRLAVVTDTTGARPVPLQGLRPRVQQLLQLLAVHCGQFVHRERIIDVLWPNASLPQGIRNLQVAVSQLRRHLAAAGVGPEAIGVDLVERRDRCYRLHLPDAELDVADFERLGTRATRPSPGRGAGETLAACEAAMRLYTDDLLPQAGLAEWVVQERARLRFLAAETATAGAGSALSISAYQRGIILARRAVQLDPHRDAGWDLLARLYDGAHDRAAAAQARQDHRSMLSELLDRADPSPAIAVARP